MGFFIIFNSNWGKDEPQILHYAIMINCPMGDDVRQTESDINKAIKSEWFYRSIAGDRLVD